MSKSLTLNVNRFTQNTNPMAVPSGSTAEPDNNVKYIPQTLTEEQQAQARQNIGAAAAGETGGATVNEFHYKRGGEEGSYYYYIDCQGYTPAEGDLMVVVFDWPMYPEHNPITLMNGSDNPSFVLLNAPASEYNYYDDIEGTVNTRWMVKLEKVNNVWTAYNVNTIELADWNITDPTAIGYIKNKPEISNRNIILSQLENKSTVKVIIDGGSTVTVTAKWRTEGYLYVKATNSITEYTNTSSNVNITLYPGFNYFIAKNPENTINAIAMINFPNTFTNKAWVYNNMQENGRLGTCTIGQQIYQVTDNNGKTLQSDDHVAGMILYSLQDIYDWHYVKDQVWPHGIVWANRDLPATLTGITVPFLNNLYIIRSKYNELVTKLNASYTTAEVENILSKVTVWDYVTQIEGRIYFNTLPTLPLTMTDENNTVITGDFVAQNVTITPAS